MIVCRWADIRPADHEDPYGLVFNVIRDLNDDRLTGDKLDAAAYRATCYYIEALEAAFRHAHAGIVLNSRGTVCSVRCEDPEEITPRLRVLAAEMDTVTIVRRTIDYLIELEEALDRPDYLTSWKATTGEYGPVESVRAVLLDEATALRSSEEYALAEEVLQLVAERLPSGVAVTSLGAVFYGTGDGGCLGEVIRRSVVEVVRGHCERAGG